MQSALQFLQPPAAQPLVQIQLLLLHVVMDVQVHVKHKCLLCWFVLMNLLCCGQY